MLRLMLLAMLALAVLMPAFAAAQVTFPIVELKADRTLVNYQGWGINLRVLAGTRGYAIGGPDPANGTIGVIWCVGFDTTLDRGQWQEVWDVSVADALYKHAGALDVPIGAAPSVKDVCPVR